MGEGFVEVRERKLLATIGTAFMLAWPIGVFMLLWFASSSAGGIDTVTVIVLSVVLSIPALASTALYRFPRVLRLYVQEQLAHRYRAVYQLAVFSWWEDLSTTDLEVRREYVVEREADDKAGGSVVLLGCVFALLGPIGLLLSLGLQKKRDVRKPVYALRCGRHSPPLLILEKRKEVERVAELFQALPVTGPSDLVSRH